MKPWQNTTSETVRAASRRLGEAEEEDLRDTCRPGRKAGQDSGFADKRFDAKGYIHGGMYSTNPGLAMNFSTDAIQAEVNLEIHGGVLCAMDQCADKPMRDSFTWGPSRATRCGG